VIRYALQCAEGCRFEAWFASSDAYDRQAASGLVECPQCGSAEVSKQVMAPAVRTSAKSELMTNAAPDFDSVARKVQAHIRKNYDYVGGNFAAEARAMLYRELGFLLRAGLPLADALDLLIQSPEMGENRAVLARVRDRIRDGEAFATAWGEADRHVTTFESAALEVGERSASLEGVLHRLADYIEDQQVVQEKIKSALLYPVMVLLVAILAGILILGVLLPAFHRLVADTDVTLPLITEVMLGVGNWAHIWLLPVLLSVGLAAWYLRRRYRMEPHFRERVQRRMLDLPVLGRALTALVNVRFARTLALLLRGGVPLVEGLALSGRATGNSWVAASVERETEAVRHGDPLADAIARVPALRGSLPSWIRAGEASGELTDLLDNAAQRYQQQWDRLMTRSVALIEPILILLVGGFVLLLALSIILPILSFNSVLS